MNQNCAYIYCKALEISVFWLKENKKITEMYYLCLNRLFHFITIHIPFFTAP